MLQALSDDKTNFSFSYINGYNAMAMGLEFGNDILNVCMNYLIEFHCMILDNESNVSISNEIKIVQTFISAFHFSTF